jgi:hypothetical protein
MPKAYGTPGPRAIYPDICTSRTMAAVSVRAQLLFDRLIAQADDQGRIEGDATIVKAICVPLVADFTLRTTEAALVELVRADLVLRYKAERNDLIQLVTWWRWQAGMRRAYPSRYPAPPEWNDVVFGLGDDTPKTYRDAVGLIKGARKLPAELPAELPAVSPQAAGNLPTLAGARLPAPAQPLPVPSAGAGAGAGAYSPQPPASGGRPSRANGTSRRQVDAQAQAEQEASAKAKRWRRNQRQLAAYRGAISESQRIEMDERDAPLDEIPDWLQHVASLDRDRVGWLDQPAEAKS